MAIHPAALSTPGNPAISKAISPPAKSKSTPATDCSRRTKDPDGIGGLTLSVVYNFLFPKELKEHGIDLL